MKYLVFALALLAPVLSQAAPGSYVVQCVSACTAPDGVTQLSAGAFINRIIADPSVFSPGANLTLVPDTGQTVWGPPAPVGTTLTKQQLIARFTTTEAQNIKTAANTTDSDAWVIYHIHLQAVLPPSLIDLSTPQWQQDFQTLVNDGYLTPARAALITNLAVSSP